MASAVEDLVQYSIHAPRKGSDRLWPDWAGRRLWFQSTLPVRGATHSDVTAKIMELFQSTLPVRGSDACFWTWLSWSWISIHAPRKGGSDGRPEGVSRAPGISIHAPRKGSDANIQRHAPHGVFQSTLPVRGATWERRAAESLLFQSTLPVKGATRHRKNGSTRPRFQSTLPVKGSDHLRGAAVFDWDDFNPRSP